MGELEEITNKIQVLKIEGKKKNKPPGVARQNGKYIKRKKTSPSPNGKRQRLSPDEILSFEGLKLQFGKKVTKVKNVGLTPEDYTIKTSTIPNAGNGAFTNVFLPKGSVLGAYKGKKLSKSAYERLADDSYVWELSSRHGPVYMDGKDPKLSNWLRFLNDSRDRRINVEPYQYRQKIYYRTIRSVKPEQELFVSYGDHYW